MRVYFLAHDYDTESERARRMAAIARAGAATAASLARFVEATHGAGEAMRRLVRALPKEPLF